MDLGGAGGAGAGESVVLTALAATLLARDDVAPNDDAGDLLGALGFDHALRLLLDPFAQLPVNLFEDGF
ncbi:hypothetical protein PG996_011303 [Apiospora saccharicola]|uniref:Uncharacterized protein n=1 Tax=Apiospora saccharicola TaxID=335842 RepID=A0ABR1UGX4_9PEZI